MKPIVLISDIKLLEGEHRSELYSPSSVQLRDTENKHKGQLSVNAWVVYICRDHPGS